MSLALPSAVPTLSSNALVLFLVQVGLLLSSALVLGRIATRLGLPAVVGELCAGLDRDHHRHRHAHTYLGARASRLGHWEGRRSMRG